MAEALITGFLCTLAEAKARLKQPTASTTYDDLITELINEVTGAIEAHCGRKLLSRTHTAQLHDGTGTTRLMAREYPVNGVTAAAESLKDGVSADRTIDVSGTKLQIEGRRFLFLPEGWPAGTANIKLTYTGGYTTTHPADVKALRGAALDWIADRFAAFMASGGAEVTVSAGGDSVTVGAHAMPRRVEQALRPYRRAV